VPAEKPRLLAIMGSGETAPTMTRVHRALLDRLGPPPVPAVVLDTPFGFQGNADDISARTVEYFRESVQRDIAVASYRSAEEASPLEYETMLNRLRQADYVFSGPGSPSYALGQWQGSQVPALLAEKLATGGCVTFASAAAVTLGPFALPVYEIYKAGERPHWLEGLDLTTGLGLPAVVIPHFDNAEGGSHDTRYCYMGERRLRVLEALLPEGVFVLGVDEHTACVLDLGAGTASVTGRGAVTVRRRGRMARVDSGETVPLADLPRLVDTSTSGRSSPSDPRNDPGDRHGGRAGAPTHSSVAGGPSPLLAELGRLRSEFDSAMAEADPQGAVKAALALDDLVVDWSRDTLQSDQLDQARAILRSTLVRLGEAAEGGLRDPREVARPFVEAVVDARSWARQEGRWSEADLLRDRLADAGVEVHDTPEGTTWDLRRGSAGHGLP
jgi:cyanophycinase-like exopeptidase